MDWLEILYRYGYSVSDCVAVTLGTDGLDPGFNRVACVTTLPIMGDEKPSTIYVEGADIYASMPYTGINEITYRSEAVSRSLARERLRAALEPYKVVVGHNMEGFGRLFLWAFDRRLADDKVFLDTQILSRYFYEKYPVALKGYSTIEAFQREAARAPYDKSRGWRLKNLCQFDPPGVDNQPEVNAVRVKSLFIYLLGREAPIPRALET